MYARERARRDKAQKLYRIYVTDCLKGVAGAEERYMEWVEPREDFDPEAVIDHVLSRV